MESPESMPINFAPDVPDTPPPTLGGELPKYNVMLYDCDCHSPDQVQYGLHYLVGLPKEVAQQKTFGAHTLGKTIVITTHKEAAEYYAYRLMSVTGMTGAPLNVAIEKV